MNHSLAEKDDNALMVEKIQNNETQLNDVLLFSKSVADANITDSALNQQLNGANVTDTKLSQE